MKTRKSSVRSCDTDAVKAPNSLVSAAVRRVRFVVVEDGAPPFASYVSPDECEETVVVSQLSGELPSELAERALRRIATVTGSEKKIEKAIVLVSPRQDEGTMRARRLVVGALLTHAHASGPEESSLVLAADGNTAPALRDDLLALVEGLIGDSESCSVPISLSFDAPEPPSAVRGRKIGPYSNPAYSYWVPSYGV